MHRIVFSLKDVNGNHFAHAIMPRDAEGKYSASDIRVLGRTPQEAGDALALFLEEQETTLVADVAA